jgi:HPr kinase/phosphorylase
VEIQTHGALVEILGAGVLLLGASGVGKSECALELVRRRHRLVADDVVRLRRVDAETVVGSAPERIRHYMEIRGIGLLYIPELYGKDSVRDESTVDLVCHLEFWRKGAEYERIGIERPSEAFAGVQVPMLVLPVRPASSMATLIEVAARDTLQRRRGINAARRLDDSIRESSSRVGDDDDDGENQGDSE